MPRDLEVLELGNADLYGEGQWTGTPETADGRNAPLPGYPQPQDKPPSPLRDLAAALFCSLLTVSSFVGVFVIAAYIHGWRPA